MSRRLILNAVLRGQLGGHTAAWRVSSSDVREVTTLGYWTGLASTLEKAKFDSLFFADVLAVPDDPNMSLQWPVDPLILIASIGAVTKDIGVVATHSTSFNSPYNTARQLSAIDHLTGGRAGWNVVTSSLEGSAGNFGSTPLPEHDLRYRVAGDYLDAVKKLWTAWADDAIVADRVSGQLFDTDRIRSVHHDGEFFEVRGPITTSRSPQTVPVIAQAGGSAPGIDLAARHADIVYTRQVDLQGAQQYYSAIKNGAVGYGRNPEHVKILPGFVPVVGDSEAEAVDYVRHLRDLNDLPRRLPQFGDAVGISFDRSDLDEEFPYEKLDVSTGSAVRSQIQRSGVVSGPVSLREVLQQVYGPMSESSGHRVVANTASRIADTIAEWFHARALDGISVHPHVLPDGLDAFAESVVPLLQDRGLVQTEYAPGTLRDKLGLPIPTVDDTAFTPAWSHAGAAVPTPN